MRRAKKMEYLFIRRCALSPGELKRLAENPLEDKGGIELTVTRKYDVDLLATNYTITLTEFSIGKRTKGPGYMLVGYVKSLNDLGPYAATIILNVQKDKVWGYGDLRPCDYGQHGVPGYVAVGVQEACAITH